MNTNPAPTGLPLPVFFIVTTKGDGLRTGATIEEATAPFRTPVWILVYAREATPSDLAYVRGTRKDPAPAQW